MFTMISGVIPGRVEDANPESRDSTMCNCTSEFDAPHRPGMTGAALFRLQLQRRRIDAVAQAGGAGAVVEDVAEMAVALRAQNFGADHAVARVALLVDM